MKTNSKELKKLHSFLTTWAENLAEELELFEEELEEEVSEERAEELYTGILETLDAYFANYKKRKQKAVKFANENFKYWSIS